MLWRAEGLLLKISDISGCAYNKAPEIQLVSGACVFMGARLATLDYENESACYFLFANDNVMY
jgi:hypothetical protein